MRFAKPVDATGNSIDFKKYKNKKQKSSCDAVICTWMKKDDWKRATSIFDCVNAQFTERVNWIVHTHISITSNWISNSSSVSQNLFRCWIQSNLLLFSYSKWLHLAVAGWWAANYRSSSSLTLSNFWSAVRIRPTRARVCAIINQWISSMKWICWLLAAAVVMVAQGQFSYMISPHTHASYIVSAVVDQNPPTDGWYVEQISFLFFFLNKRKKSTDVKSFI